MNLAATLKSLPDMSPAAGEFQRKARGIRGFFPIVLASLILGGCATRPPPEPLPVFPGLRKQEAQLQRFTREDLTLSAEAVFSRGRGDDVALFVSKGSVPQLEIMRIGDVWYADGKLAWKQWIGGFDAIPARLRGWTVLLQAYQAADEAPDGDSIRRSGDDWAAYLKEDGRLIGLSVRHGGQNYRVRFNE